VVPVGAPATAAVAQGLAMITVAQGPATPTVVPVGTPTAAVAAKEPVATTTVPVGTPLVAVAGKEPAAPVVGPAGVLTSAATKGGPVSRWGRAATVMVSRPGGVAAMAKTWVEDLGRSRRSGPSGPDLGQGDVVEPDLG
jgi:hypothetical protein